MKKILEQRVINVASYLQQPITFYENGTLVGSDVDIIACIVSYWR